MHYSLILQIMRHNGLAHLLDRDRDRPNLRGNGFRKLLLMTVLATDLSVHDEFMNQFRSMLEQGVGDELFKKKMLLCQALIKCADISNPVCYVLFF